MSFSALSTITVEQMMEDVSFHLVEQVVNTILGSFLNIGGNTYVSTPGSMQGIYVGAFLLIDEGLSNQEQVTVLSITPTSFSAQYVNPHTPSSTINAATFPSGATDHPLFTQTEIMGYLAEVHNDFLLKTRCIFGVTGTASEPSNLPLVAQQRFYSQPFRAIRVERVARIIPGMAQPIMDLYDTTQSDLDMTDFSWSSESDIPNSWFRDQIDTAKIGLNPMPNVNGSLEVWYSKRGFTGSDTITLSMLLLVPDVMSHYIKYGILYRCWSKDGEYRDPLRAEYCKKRYEFGVKVVQRFMEGLGVETGQQQDYSPMAVPGS